MANFPICFLGLFCISNAYAISDSTFPTSFMFGAGSSAYQIEGAWADENKGPNIWDNDLHANASLVEDGTNGDIADNSFYYHDEDVEALKKMGVNHYKFSISWSRIFPEGVYVNDTEGWTGIGYYQRLIESLLNNNITPIVSFYHWDLPQPIQQWGGWTNESTIELFVNYVRFSIDYFFEAPYFITFDNPKEICKSGYGDGSLSPFKKNSGVDDYICAKNILKAHAAVYKMFKDEYAEVLPDTKLSIALDFSWSEAASDSDDDKDAAERRNQFEFGLYANPIFNGDWPQVVKDRVQLRSTGEGLGESRLPTFTDAEISAIKGTIDFMAIDFFDTRLVSNVEEADFGTRSYENDMRVQTSVDDSWKIDADGQAFVQGSLRKALKYLKENYGDPDILITANGMADSDGTTHDGDRVTFLAEELTDVIDSITEDEVKVFGYTYWSLLDSFEWIKGYKSHYGLFGINLDLYDNSSTRLPKRSSLYYSYAIGERKIPDLGSFVTTTTTTSSSTTTTTPEPTHAPRKSTTTSIPTTIEPKTTTTEPKTTTTEPKTTTSHSTNIKIPIVSTLALVILVVFQF